jgi:hypothetical protein
MFHVGPHAAEIDRIDQGEGFGRFLSDVGSWGLYTGVVERHVHPAECRGWAVDHGSDLVFRGDITQQPSACDGVQISECFHAANLANACHCLDRCPLK